MRDTLLEQASVKEAAVDYDQGLAYVLPEGKFDSAQAIQALGKAGDYKATLK